MKNWIEAFQVMDYISVGLLLTTLSINGLRRLESYVKVYTLNSWLLGGLIAAVAGMRGESHLYIAAVTTLLGKGIIIPFIIMRLVKTMKVTKEVEPYISNALSLSISGILIALVYATLHKGLFVSGFSRITLQVSIAMMFIGLFVMITRKKAITHVVGLLFMENGLFLAGFSLTLGFPMFIELGILFDLLMGIIILGVFAVQIKRLFASADLDKLTILKG